MTIKPGTARRLGLRQPPTPGLLEHPKPMTEQEFADLKDRWRLEHGVVVLTEEERDLERGVTIRRGRTEPDGETAPTTVTLDNTGATWIPNQPLRPLRPPPRNQVWLAFTESRRERRKRLGLHWWQREVKR